MRSPLLESYGTSLSGDSEIGGPSQEQVVRLRELKKILVGACEADEELQKFLVKASEVDARLRRLRRHSAEESHQVFARSNRERRFQEQRFQEQRFVEWRVERLAHNIRLQRNIDKANEELQRLQNEIGIANTNLQDFLAEANNLYPMPSVASDVNEINRKFLSDADEILTTPRNLIAMADFLATDFVEFDFLSSDSIGLWESLGSGIAEGITLTLTALYVGYQFYWSRVHTYTRSLEGINGLFYNGDEADPNEEEKLLALKEKFDKLLLDINKNLDKRDPRWAYVINKRRKWLFGGKNTHELLLYRSRYSVESKQTVLEKLKQLKTEPIIASIESIMAPIWRLIWDYSMWYWIIWMALVLLASFAVAGLPWVALAAVICVLIQRAVSWYWSRNKRDSGDLRSIAASDYDLHATYLLRWCLIEAELLQPGNGIGESNEPYAKVQRIHDVMLDEMRFLLNEDDPFINLKWSGAISTGLNWFLMVNFASWSVGALVVAAMTFLEMMGIGLGLTIGVVSWPVVLGLVIGMLVVSIGIGLYQGWKAYKKADEQYNSNVVLLQQKREKLEKVHKLLERKLAENRGANPVLDEKYNHFIDQMLDQYDYKFQWKWCKGTRQVLKDFIIQGSYGGLQFRIAIMGMLLISADGLMLLAGVGFASVFASLPPLWVIGAALILFAAIYGACRAFHLYRERKVERQRAMLDELEIYERWAVEVDDSKLEVDSHLGIDSAADEPDPAEKNYSGHSRDDHRLFAASSVAPNTAANSDEMDGVTSALVSNN